MGECGVCIGGYDFDGQMECFNRKMVNSRKDHKCVECRRQIAKGIECEVTSGKWEGKFNSDYTCLDCMNIRDGLSCGEPMAIGMLGEDIDEHFSELTTGCLLKIETASAKAYLLERWNKWKGLIK